MNLFRCTCEVRLSVSLPCCVAICLAVVLGGQLAQCSDEFGILDLRKEEITDDIISQIQNDPTVRFLLLEGSTIDDGGLKKLGKLPALDSLALSNTKVTNDGIQSLVRSCPGLRSLKLAHTSIGDTAVAAISTMPHLQELDLSSTAITDQAFQSLNTMTGLMMLSVNNNRLSGSGLARLHHLPNLRSLEANGVSCRGSWKSSDSFPRTLTGLNLNHAKIARETVMSVGRLSNLRLLSLQYAEIDGEFTELKELPELEHVYLDGTKTGSSTVGYLQNATKLRALSLRGTRIDDSIAQQLVLLPSLQYLDLGDTAVSDNALRGVGKLRNLRELVIDRTKITDAGMKHLTTCSNLEVLVLCLTDITDRGSIVVRGLRSLRRLDMQGTLITELELEQLRKALPQCRVDHCPRSLLR